METRYDVIVIGLGAMGSAGLYHLARSGAQVLGLDRFKPPHKRGSSHGQTRVIREAYFEDPAYVPLLQRAYTLWEELEQASGVRLLQQTGGLMMGPQGSTLYEGALRSAQLYTLPHQLRTAAEIQAQWPGFVLPAEMRAVQEPRTGYLYPEKAIAAQLRLAQQAGADIRTETQVLGWKKEAGGYAVQTQNETYHAEKLVFTAGAWLGKLVPELALPLQITRQTLFWFQPLEPALFQPGAFPVFVMEYRPGQYLYGFPDEGQGFKIARHVPGAPLNPEDLPDEQVSGAEVDAMRGILLHFFPAANGPLKQTAVCMYTLTPDHHFLIDWHPEEAGILLVSPCSGHGFKFSAVIGELIADFCQRGQSDFDLSLFACKRFQSR